VAGLHHLQILRHDEFRPPFATFDLLPGIAGEAGESLVGHRNGAVRLDDRRGGTDVFEHRPIPLHRRRHDLLGDSDLFQLPLLSPDDKTKAGEGEAGAGGKGQRPDIPGGPGVIKQRKGEKKDEEQEEKQGTFKQRGFLHKEVFPF